MLAVTCRLVATVWIVECLGSGLGLIIRNCFFQVVSVRVWSGNWKDLGIWGLERSGLSVWDAKLPECSYTSQGELHAGLGGVVLEEGGLPPPTLPPSPGNMPHLFIIL